jgi:NAD(P)-dependent dehydrogenase (short-subunit alcohol dehydrogenase family)
MRELSGRTALVTGAASGIGLGIAQALAGAGMNVVLADRRSEPLEQARRAIAMVGAPCVAAPTDVMVLASVAAAGRAAEDAFGKLHVVVNNAGIAMHGIPIEHAAPETWRQVIGVNVMGVINGIRALMPLIRRHGEGGHVVNTASISGFFVREGRNQGGYAMTKYAVVALSEALEQETKGSGIGVSVLCPGPVETAFFTTEAARADGAAPSFRSFANPMLPTRVGQRVLDAIRNDEFYVFTHSDERAVVEARHARIAAAFERADAWVRNDAG